MAVLLRGEARIAVTVVVSRRAVWRRMIIMISWGGRGPFYHPDIDCHLVIEVLISCDQSIFILVLKADSLGDGRTSIRVQPVEILDSRDNRICCIMGVYIDTERQARSVLGGPGKYQLERDVLGGRRPRRHTAAGGVSRHTCRTDRR